MGFCRKRWHDFTAVISDHFKLVFFVEAIVSVHSQKIFEQAIKQVQRDYRRDSSLAACIETDLDKFMAAKSTFEWYKTLENVCIERFAEIIVRMRSKSKIYILTGPIRSGKTSALLRWSADIKSIGGILTPDINGERVFQILPDNQILPMLANSEEEVLDVGRFRFSKHSFEKAIQSIYRSIEEKKEWIVIDEIGPLELRAEGFANVLRDMLQNKERDYKILLVVREGLPERVIVYFGMVALDVKIVGKEDLMPGLV